MNGEYMITMAGLPLAEAAGALGSLPGLISCDYDPESGRGRIAFRIGDDQIVAGSFRSVHDGRSTRLHMRAPEGVDVEALDRAVQEAIRAHSLIQAS